MPSLVQSEPFPHHECKPGWSHWLSRKSSKRPIFEEKWACSESCLMEYVAAAVEREGNAVAHRSIAPRHRIPLGLALLQDGLITQAELQDARTAQQEAGYGQIGLWLQRTCGISEWALLRTLAKQWSCSLLHEPSKVEHAVYRSVPIKIARSLQAIPVGFSSRGEIQLGYRDVPDASLAYAVERMNRIPVEQGFLGTGAFENCQKLFEESSRIPTIEASVSSESLLVPTIVRQLNDLQPIRSKLVRIHQMYWLRAWLEDLGSSSEWLPAGTAGVCDLVFEVAIPS